MNRVLNLEKLYFLLLIGSMYFVIDFIPIQIILFVGSILVIRCISNLNAYFIYPLQAFLIYLLYLNFDKTFTPESSTSFLLGLCAIQILHGYNGKSKKTEYLVGLLFLGSLTLFNSTIGFVLYLLSCIMIAISLISEINLFSNIKKEKVIKNIFIISVIFLIASILFIFFPRFKGILPSTTPSRMGEVGYSKELRNSDVSALSINDKVAFYAIMDKLEQKDLYWRARVLNYTDGYNWKATEKSLLNKKLEFSGKSIEYQLKFEQSFYGDLITLDVPKSIDSSKLRVYSQNSFQTFQSYDQRSKNTITATSYLNSPKTTLSKWEKSLYLQIPKFTPRKLKNIINQISSSEPSIVISFIKNYLKDNNFTYTLSPGKMPTMASFINNKKGFCSHYASFLAIIFRAKSIPSRIVSGFQGGIYNELSSYYKVNASNAHAWVEYWDKDRWQRVDPTAFVAPLRLSENFSFTSNGEVTNTNKFSLPFLNKLNQYYESLNVRFTIFIDNIDQNFQREIAKKIKLNLNSFYFLGTSLLIVFLLIFFLLSKKYYSNLSMEDKLFNNLIKMLKKENIEILPTDDFKSILKKINVLQDEKKEKIILFLTSYQKYKYSKVKDLNSLKKFI